MIASWLYTVTEYDVDELSVPIRYWADGLTDREAKEIIESIWVCFTAWKQKQRDASGNVVVHDSGGLSSLGPVSKPASDVQPWECAGPLVHNEIDLAFKLWVDRYRPFEELLARFGFRAWAVVGLMAVLTRREGLHLDSLIRLNGFLGREIIQLHKITAELWDRERRGNEARLRGLKKARAQSAASRKERANQTKVEVRQMASEYLRAHPSHGTAEAAQHIWNRYPWKQKRPKISTIKEWIEGVKTKALRSMERTISEHTTTRK